MKSESKTTTRPSTEPTILEKSRAILASNLMLDGRVLTLTDKITLGRSTSPICFGELDTIEKAADSDDDKIVDTVPAIVWQVGTTKRGLIVEDSRLKGATWSFVGSGPSTNEIYGALDASLDEDQKEILLVHSINGGETFAISAVKKPNPHAVFDSFCMAADGKGRLTVYLANAGGKQRAQIAGYYHFHTSDGGKTWSAPEREPDSMRQADSVDSDSDDQIDPPVPSQRAQVDRLNTLCRR